MTPRELPLLGRIDGPAPVPLDMVRRCKSYREAVRMSWELRRIKSMSKAHMAYVAELTPQHVSDYLASDDKPGRRDLPAEAISRFESAVGNRLVSQWLALESELTVLETLQATHMERMAA